MQRVLDCLPSVERPQHLGSLDGMQKKSDDIRMATVPSVTYLRRKHADFDWIIIIITPVASHQQIRTFLLATSRTMFVLALETHRFY